MAVEQKGAHAAPPHSAHVRSPAPPKLDVSVEHAKRSSECRHAVTGVDVIEALFLFVCMHRKGWMVLFRGIQNRNSNNV